MKFLGGIYFSMQLDKIHRIADTLESVREYMIIVEVRVQRPGVCYFALAAVIGLPKKAEGHRYQIKIAGEVSCHEFDAGAGEVATL